MAVQPKRIFNLSEMHKGELLEQYFSKKKSECLQNIIADKQFLTLYEMYISELVVKLFRQLRGNSPFDHVKDHFVPYEINKRRKSEFTTSNNR